MPDGKDGRVVLVVQEEIVTRLDIADEFDKAGFKVFQAGTAVEAITVLRSLSPNRRERTVSAATFAMRWCFNPRARPKSKAPDVGRLVSPGSEGS